MTHYEARMARVDCWLHEAVCGRREMSWARVAALLEVRRRLCLRALAARSERLRHLMLRSNNCPRPRRGWERAEVLARELGRCDAAMIELGADHMTLDTDEDA